MKYNHYIARKRTRISGIGGIQVNIPYGSKLEARDGFIFFEERPLCAVTSQNAYDYFSQDDDGCGKERGALVTAIMDRLGKKNKAYQKRWDQIWNDPLCQKYRRSEHEDHWLWNYDFYNAPVEDLRHIAALIGVKV